MQPPYMPPAETPKKRNNTLIWILVLGGLGLCLLLIIPIGAAILFPVFAQAKLAAQKTTTLTNAKQLALGMIMYTADNNDRYPRAQNWCDAVSPHVSNPAVFSSALDLEFRGGYDFAFAMGLSSKNALEVDAPERTAMLFESATDAMNQFGGKSLLPKPGRCTVNDSKGSIIAMVDGGAKAVSDEELASVAPSAIRFP